MRLVFGISFGAIFAVAGARFAGLLTDLIQMQKRFESPDQVVQFRLIAEVSVTLVSALVGVAIGVVVAEALKLRLFRREM